MILFEVKSYIKDTNDFLKQLRSLTDLPNDNYFMFCRCCWLIH